MQKARKLGLIWVVDIQLSPLSKKKYRVYLSDGSHVDYGSFGMSDYLTHKDEKRRSRFHQRFQNNKGYNNPQSGLYYSADCYGKTPIPITATALLLHRFQ
jgi:hypothetical protein